MPFPKLLKGQVIASSCGDLQGEDLTRDELEEYVARAPERMPLRQRHDLGQEVIGYLQNFRVVGDPDRAGCYNLLADIEVTTDEVAPDLSGFSVGFLSELDRNAENADLFVYLPLPLYRDASLVQSILDDESSVCVGKFVKKQLDPVSIGLIAAAVVLVISPEWDIQYREHVRPRIVCLLQLLPKILERGASVDLLQTLEDLNGNQVQVVFLPERGNEPECLAPERIEQGLAAVKFFLNSDPKSSDVGVQRVTMTWRSGPASYRIANAEYTDGSVFQNV